MSLKCGSEFSPIAQWQESKISFSKFAILIIWTSLLETAVLAAVRPAAAIPKVTACAQIDGELYGDFLVLKKASSVYRSIGIVLEWASPQSCPADGIRIGLSRNTPKDLLPTALAYALPLEGTHIRIFLDRVERKDPPLSFHLLPYVLVHEITHILQGTMRHSAVGVMKANWNVVDFDRIRRDELPFALEDVNMILIGIQRRAAQQSRTAGPPTAPPLPSANPAASTLLEACCRPAVR